MCPTWVVSSERHHPAALREAISLHKVGGDGALQQHRDGHTTPPQTSVDLLGPVLPAQMWRTAELPTAGPDEERWLPGRSETSLWF